MVLVDAHLRLAQSRKARSPAVGRWPKQALVVESGRQMMIRGEPAESGQRFVSAFRFRIRVVPRSSVLSVSIPAS